MAENNLINSPGTNSSSQRNSYALVPNRDEMRSIFETICSRDEADRELGWQMMHNVDLRRIAPEVIGVIKRFLHRGEEIDALEAVYASGRLYDRNLHKHRVRALRNKIWNLYGK